MPVAPTIAAFTIVSLRYILTFCIRYKQLVFPFIELIGARGFEPPTSASRTLRANQAALRPVSDIIGRFNLYCKLVRELGEVLYCDN